MKKPLNFWKNMKTKNLSRIRKNEAISTTSGKLIAAYKGSMKKQTPQDFEKQLKELRTSW
jgi:hypothetical protein